MKAEGGGDPKRSPRCEERDTRRRRSPRGARIELELTASSRHRTPAGSKALKSGARELARVTPQAIASNGKRA